MLIRHLFDLKAGLRGDLLQHAAALADDNSLVGILLRDDHRVNIPDLIPFFSFSFLHGQNLDRDAVRHLLLQAAQRFFPDDLGCNRPHRLIRNGLFIIIHRALRKMGKDCIQDAVDVHAAQRAHRYDLIEGIKLPVQIHVPGNLRLRYRIDLIHDQNHRLFLKLQL